MTQFWRESYLLLLNIWGLLVKGLRKYQPSNFGNDLTQGELKSGPSSSSGAGAGRQTFSWDLQLWKLITLMTFDLQTPYLQYWKILTFLSASSSFALSACASSTSLDVTEDTAVAVGAAAVRVPQLSFAMRNYCFLLWILWFECSLDFLASPRVP